MLCISIFKFGNIKMHTCQIPFSTCAAFEPADDFDHQLQTGHHLCNQYREINTDVEQACLC